MRKSLALVLFVASSFGMGIGGTLCLAAEDANPKPAASPEAMSPQASQQKMHQLSQRKMHRMQKTGNDKPLQGDSATAPTSEGTPNPSQRSMRQKLKKAKPKAPAAENSAPN